MNLVLAYVVRPRTETQRRLERVFEHDPVLTEPVMSRPYLQAGPFDDEQLRDLKTNIEWLEEALTTPLFDEGVVIVPESLSTISLAAALQAARESLSSEDAAGLASGSTPNDLWHVGEVREDPRCLTIWLDHFPGTGMAPGAGVIVDKHSRRVFWRRAIDVRQLFNPGG